MQLWIAEKPAAGRNIADALGGGKASNGMIDVGGGRIITWTIGHLLESLRPEDYDSRYSTWSLDHLPIIPERMRYKPAKEKLQQLNIIRGLVQRASEVVIACDAAREGEAIAWLVLEYCGWKGPTKRFWTSALTPAALKKAASQLIDDAEKRPLYIAARLRASIDWADGMNWSRYYNLRCKERYDRPISLGRVQTATLALVVDRDKEIEDFKPEDYFDVRAYIRSGPHELDLWHAPRGEHRIRDKAQADELARAALNANTVLEVESKPKRFSPPPPYSLPELQIHASSKWGWTSDRTLDVLQKLYEAGAVTYPRTDSSCLTQDMKVEMPKHLAALAKRSAYRQFVPADPVLRPSIFNDKEVGDHHGIIPTDEPVDISGMGDDANRLFDLVARRFLACLMPDAEGTATGIRATIAGKVFRTSGTIITVPGWKAVWTGIGDPDDDAENKPSTSEDAPPSGKVLPPVRHGDPADVPETSTVTRTTKAPPRFTDGSLVKAMLGAGSKNPDAEIRDLLSNGGLGTGATRDSIIKRLKERMFLKNEGRYIISTQRGREFMAIIRRDGNKLADVVATANLERELRMIEKDPAKAQQIWLSFCAQLRGEIDRLIKGPAPGKLTPIQDGKFSGPQRSSGSKGAHKGSKPSGAKKVGKVGYRTA